MSPMILCMGTSWTAMCHFSYFTPDRCSAHLFLCLEVSPPSISFLFSPHLSRGGAPRLSEHQHVSLISGLWRDLGNGPPLQLALWTGRCHQHCGEGLQRRNNIVCDQDSILWPLHLHGQQQAGLQFCHLHSRYVRTPYWFSGYSTIFSTHKAALTSVSVILLLWFSSPQLNCFGAHVTLELILFAAAVYSNKKKKNLPAEHKCVVTWWSIKQQQSTAVLFIWLISLQASSMCFSLKDGKYKHRKNNENI